jgi:hypothetical protein
MGKGAQERGVRFLPEILNAEDGLECALSIAEARD